MVFVSRNGSVLMHGRDGEAGRMDWMRKKQFVKDLQLGDIVDSQFLVVSKRYLNFKRAMGKYLALTMADRTGEIQAKVWEQAEVKGRRFRSGRVAHVTGEVVLFNDLLEIHVTDIVETEDYNRDDFVVADEVPRRNGCRTSEVCSIDTAGPVSAVGRSLSAVRVVQTILLFTGRPDHTPQLPGRAPGTLPGGDEDLPCRGGTA